MKIRLAHVLSIVLLAAFAGCMGISAHPVVPRSVRVDTARLVALHPFYPVLAQYDREIAALRSTIQTPDFAGALAQLHRRFNEESAALRTISDGRDTQAAAIRRVLRVAASAPQSAAVARQIGQTYREQSGFLRAEAQRELADYETALLTQENAQYAAYARAIEERTRLAYAARAQELYENESALALELARRDAHRTLDLRLRLQGLALSAGQRSHLISELRAIHADESAVIARRRRSDEAALAALRDSLRARAIRDDGAAASDMQRRTAANMRARQAVAKAQVEDAAPLPAVSRPAGPSPNRTTADVDEFARTTAASANAVAATAAAFSKARDTLSARFAMLASNDKRYRTATLAQIEILRRERSELYRAIVAQIRALARRDAAAGAPDLTAAVASDLRRLRD